MSSHTFLTTFTRCGWRGPSLLVLDNDGWLAGRPFSGYFFRETRFLSCLELSLFGDRPWLCSLTDVEPALVEGTYIYPPVESRGGGGSGSGGTGSTHDILYRDLDLDLRYHIHPSSLEVHLVVTSRWQDAELDLAWRLDADYADLLEAEEGKRRQEAPVEVEAVARGVRFRYRHPELPFATRVVAGGPGEWEWHDGELATHLSLRRQTPTEIVLTVYPHDFESRLDAAGDRRREAKLERWHDSVTVVEGAGDLPLATMVNDAVRDVGSLALLDGEEDEWLAPAAGMPLYPALFGRDAFTIGWQAAMMDRGRMLDETYNRLARLRGRRVDDWRDEQPGRSIQQARRGPLSRLDILPYGRYYGDYASPMMFVISLAQMYAWSGERSLLERHWDAACGVLDWAREYGDMDGDGYLEYLTRSPEGPTHQGWKDSEDAVVDGEGRQVEPPIATCEVQGYWYAALQVMAVLSVVMGESGRAKSYLDSAADLKHRFNRDFWMEEKGFYAFGLDSEKRQIDSIVSNPGHCLIAGIIEDERVPRVAERLFEADLFSGWGIRTLSADNPAYNPVSYHLGSVWASENASILFGLRRYGLDDQVLELAGALYDLARAWHRARIPECVGGYARSERTHPGAYPWANSPQGWNQSAFPMMLQGLLGLRPVAALEVLAVDPLLPEWAPEMTLRGLRVGDASVDLRFWREEDGDSRYEVLAKQGTLRIVRQPPLDSLHAGLFDRLAELVTGEISL